MQLITGLRHVADFCYPRVCAVCSSLVPPPDGDELCPCCMNDLRALEGAPACDRCAAPLAEWNTPCPHCQGRGVKPFEGILRLSVLHEPVHHLIHQIKYHHRWGAAEFLADRLLEQEPVKALLGQTDVLVPVPLHPWRQMMRGYNQAELVARRLGKRCSIKVKNVVARLKNTETQTNLHSRMKRYDNMRDAFGLLHHRVLKGKHVVVIDDVLTTGATISAVGKTIMEAEPASLCAIVLAVADAKGRDFEAV